RALVAHEGLGTRVSTFEGPLEAHAFPEGHFDTVVAADVLEHFPDARGVAAEIARVLRQDGELLVSLPSENRFYELGRAAVGYTKPEDHYHEGEAVLAALGQHLEVDRRRHFPLDVGVLGVFLLARLVRRGPLPGAPAPSDT
ncbi:MAG TPA: methyltransferase domain-containing protein, partial [Myxococcota bacterium]|nr:methyltransferase domain-containing protein [Myxococcota bacterium]